jgi:hypothetical protein
MDSSQAMMPAEVVGCRHAPVVAVPSSGKAPSRRVTQVLDQRVAGSLRVEPPDEELVVGVPANDNDAQRDRGPRHETPLR